MDIIFRTDKAVFNYRVAGIWIENGHVLIHRFVNDNHWSLPGGRVSITEESKTSLKREFLEELNVNIEVERLIWVLENFFNYEGKDFHEIGYITLLNQIKIQFYLMKNIFMVLREKDWFTNGHQLMN